MNLIFKILTGFLSGVLAAMGLGGGSVLIIILSLFGTNAMLAKQINLIFFIPISLISIIFNQKNGNIKWKITTVMSIFAIIGSCCGVFLSNFVNNMVLNKMFGFLLLIIGITQLFKTNK